MFKAKYPDKILYRIKKSFRVNNSYDDITKIKNKISLHNIEGSCNSVSITIIPHSLSKPA